MLITIFLIILELLIKALLCVILTFTTILIGLKLWYEPITRMYKSDVKLTGKVALVTGGNSGIGLETARDLARRGATVIIASRDVEKSEAAVRDIIATTGNQKVLFKCLDLSKFASIRRFAEDFNKTFDRLDILVNNAGCAGLLPAVTEDGIEKVTQINYVGPFLLTNLLTEKLVASAPSRIVIVSSKANEFHDFDIDDLAAVNRKSVSNVGLFRTYANSKLCNVLWAKALSKRLPAGVTVNALHPGLVLTNIFHKVPKNFQVLIRWIIRALGKTSIEGAQTTIYLCVAAEVDGVSGEYFAECQVAKADELINNEAIVENVWEKTMVLVGGKQTS